MFTNFELRYFTKGSHIQSVLVAQCADEINHLTDLSFKTGVMFSAETVEKGNS